MQAEKQIDQAVWWSFDGIQKVKSELMQATLFTHPQPVAPACIMVDASDVAVGGVLQQHIGGEWQPIAFFSKRLQPAETTYSTFGRELLAVYLTIPHFRHVLEGRQFCVYTDHNMCFMQIVLLTEYFL